VFRNPLFTVIIVRKCKSSDAVSASEPKRRRVVLFICEKVKILVLIEIDKRSCAEIAYSSVCEMRKNKEKICASFSVALQTANFTAIAPDKVLMNVEKALNFWVEDMNRKRVPLFIKLYNYFNFGNVLLFVIYRLNLTVFMYVTLISRYFTLYVALVLSAVLVAPVGFGTH
jgi:hypothetical protein